MLHLQQFLSSPEFAQMTGLLLSGSAVSFVALWLKKLGKLESEKIIQFLVIALAVLASLLKYINSNSLQPLSNLGIDTATIVGVAQALYMYVVKPLSGFVEDVKNYRSLTMAMTNTDPSKITTASNPSAANEFKL